MMGEQRRKLQGTYRRLSETLAIKISFVMGKEKVTENQWFSLLGINHVFFKEK